MGSVDWVTGEFVRLFNPRTDRWADHFALMGGRIDAITVIGEMTVRVLAMNDFRRIEERELLRTLGRYPTAVALKRMEF